MSIEARRIEAKVMSEIPSAVAVSVKNKKVTVYVTRKDPRIVIPNMIGEYPVEVKEIGVLKALAAERTERMRPAPGGVSIGHYMVTAGTLSSGVIDRASGKLGILSNAHILTDRGWAGQVGDAILQPASYDGGTNKDKIAELRRWVKIDFGGLPNLVDCAVAQPVNGVLRDILEIGEVTQYQKDPVIGQKVKKSGRTSGLTTGEIEDIGVTARVLYGEDKIAVFRDQILTSRILEPGDSGSLLVSEDNRAVGLGFAGSELVSVHNRIGHVVDLLSIGFGEEQKTPISVPVLTLGLVSLPLAVIGGVGMRRKS